MAGQLRVAVIGSQTRHPDTPRAYTVYRTSVNYKGRCYHRLIRYRHFAHFDKNLKIAPNAPRIAVKMPPKMWWSRKASLRPEVVEARQVLLSEYMQQVCTRPLTPRSHEQLMKLLQVGSFAPNEEKDRVVDSTLGSRRRSTSYTEPTSEIVGDMLTAEAEETVNNVTDSRVSDKENHEQDARMDEEEPAAEEHIGLDLSGYHPDSQSLSCPTADNGSQQRVHAPSSPVRVNTARSFSKSFDSQHLKRVMFQSLADDSLLARKDEDSTSTLESQYMDPIKKCVADIYDMISSSRQLETHIREKQTIDRPMEAGATSM